MDLTLASIVMITSVVTSEGTYTTDPEPYRGTYEQCVREAREIQTSIREVRGGPRIRSARVWCERR